MTKPCRVIHFPSIALLLVASTFIACSNDAGIPAAGSGTGGTTRSTGGGGAGGLDERPTGSGGSSGRGGAGGSGGSTTGSGGTTTGSGGSAGSGLGGNTGSGGAGGKIDAGPDTASPDTKIDAVACPLIKCAVACPDGFATDDRGCMTCTCRSEACAPTACGPPPPSLPCPAGSNGSMTCERNTTGQCGWSRKCTPLPAACSGTTDTRTCQANVACRWLEPGCSEPKLAAAGCFDRASVGCTATSCSSGKSCVARVINPCAPAAGPAASTPSQAPPTDIAIPIPACTVCGQTTMICL